MRELFRLAGVGGMVFLSACTIPQRDFVDGSSKQDWRALHASVASSWKELPSIDADTARLPDDHLLPQTRSHVQRIFQRILSRNGLSGNAAVLVIAGCEYPSVASNVRTRTIRLCRGMLAWTQYDDDVAFILSHELSHILLGHAESERNLSNDPGGKAVRAAGVAMMVGGMFIPGVGGAIAPIVGRATAPTATFKLERRLAEVNRAEELEADLAAVDLMTTAGYDPNAAVNILDGLSAILEPEIEGARGLSQTSDDISQKYYRSLSAGRSISPNADLRSHPDVKTRIQMVRARIAGLTPVVKNPPTALATSAERDRYLDDRIAIARGSALPDHVAADRNLTMMHARRSIAVGKPQDAILGLKKMTDPGPDRWARLAAVAALYLQDKTSASGYADTYFLSGEWRRDGAGPSHPNLAIVTRLGSPDVRRQALSNSGCGESFGPLVMVCSDQDTSPVSNEQFLRSFLEEQVWEQ